jgi:hypothetical protein
MSKPDEKGTKPEAKNTPLEGLLMREEHMT